MYTKDRSFAMAIIAITVKRIIGLNLAMYLGGFDNLLNP